jgi:hypothetical protein
LVGRLPQEVVRQPKRRLPANTRKTRQLRRQIING